MVGGDEPNVPSGSWPQAGIDDKKTATSVAASLTIEYRLRMNMW